jgi:dihydrofolate reductase
MARLIMWNIVSIDGCFEGTTPWSLGWFQDRLDDSFFRFVIRQLKTANMLVFGRATYQGMEAHWTKATGEVADMMNTVPKIVFSRSLAAAEWKNTRLVHDDPVATLRDLKRDTTGNIFVFGSAALSLPLINADLFDEYRLGLKSIVLAQGRPLFPSGTNFKNLDLAAADVLSPNCVVLHYVPAGASGQAQAS